MMKLKINKLNVNYNGILVGYLYEDESERIMFQYDNDWINDGFSISPFSLPLTKQIYQSKSPHFGGLFGVFNDSLPDGWGELLVRKMLNEKGINFDRLSPLTRLTLLSDKGLGGLSYEPSQSDVTQDDWMDLDEISLEIGKILSDINDNIDLDKIYRFGGSSGGARPKVHLKIDDEEWIIKFPSHLDPRNMGVLEYETNQYAQACGIKTADHQLFPSKKGKGYFGSKRFDRDSNKRIHMISLSALLETTHRIPNLDYAHLFQVIQRICVNQEDLYEAYTRMCFNVFFENKDDHGKNISFLYDESQKGYRLAPAYDLTQTKNRYEHEMTILGNGNPTEEDLLKMAKEFKLSMKRVIDIIDRVKKIAKK